MILTSVRGHSHFSSLTYSCRQSERSEYHIVKEPDFRDVNSGLIGDDLETLIERASWRSSGFLTKTQ